MRIITVSETESTNAFLKALHQQEAIGEPVCVRAQNQTAGRGQHGTVWVSNTLENLTFSILVPNLNLPVAKQFMLNMQVSLKLLKVLQHNNVPKLSVKWPNDIMAGRYKLGGILIETSIANRNIKEAIIGIGLNVNQTTFEGLPKATSIRIQNNSETDLKALLEAITTEFDDFKTDLSNVSLVNLKTSYESQLFKKNKVSIFETSSGEMFNGIISGVSDAGKLIVNIGNLEKTFDLKEISLKF